MANTGGPWGGNNSNNSGNSGGKNPFGGNNKSPFNQNPIDLDDVIIKLRNKFKNSLPNGGNSSNFVILLLMASFALWMLSGFYRVESDQVGIELLF